MRKLEFKINEFTKNLEETKNILEGQERERDIIFTEDIQVKNLAYREKVYEILAFTQKLIDKQAKAEEQIKTIKNTLVGLNVECLKEDDPVKQQALENRKKELHLEMQNLEELLHTNILSVVNAKYLKQLEPYKEDARKENIEFKHRVADRISYYLRLEELIDIRKKQLALLQRHPIDAELEYLLKDIKTLAMSNINSKDGWVGKGETPYRKNGETTYISIEVPKKE
jgi:hypothetical protein